MDVRFINPFLEATLEVIKTMAFLEPVAAKPYVKEGDAAAGDVSAIIGLTGDAVGSLALSFTEGCLLFIVGKMLGETFQTANQEVFDAAGEITNMVSGVARSKMQRHGLSIYAAIPTIVCGKDHTVTHILKCPSIVIPFYTDHGKFVVDVCVRTVEGEVKRPEDYQVLNVKTAVNHPPPAPPPREPAPAVKPLSDRLAGPAPPPAAVDSPRDINIDAIKGDVDRMQRLKQKLAELVAARDGIQKELMDKPFMEMETRKRYKKQLPVYDEKIKRLKLDIRGVEMLSKLTQEDIDNPKIPKHFQNYENRKR